MYRLKTVIHINTSVQKISCVKEMGRIDINLPDDIEHELRMEAGKRLGAKRGAFTEAITEAVRVWLDPEAQKLVDKYRTKESKGKKKA